MAVEKKKQAAEADDATGKQAGKKSGAAANSDSKEQDAKEKKDADNWRNEG